MKFCHAMDKVLMYKKISPLLLFVFERRPHRKKEKEILNIITYKMVNVKKPLSSDPVVRAPGLACRRYRVKIPP